MTPPPVHLVFRIYARLLDINIKWSLPPMATPLLPTLKPEPQFELEPKAKTPFPPLVDVPGIDIL